jgi:hypothetical protein
MPRPRGPHSDNVSKAVAVRLPLELLGRMHAAAGADSGSQLAEWMRNVIRRAVHVPLDYKAGYEEGKMQGWAEAQGSMKTALKGFYGSIE